MKSLKEAFPQIKIIVYSMYFAAGIVQNALTRREKTVLELLLRRLNNDQIALEMGIKRRAVDNYVSLIYEKTGVNDRNALIEKYGQ